MLRFTASDRGLIPITKGMPPLAQYLNVLPFIAVLVPLGFQLQGLYRLRRGRSRVDDFFAVFVGSILAVVFGIVGTLYVQTYFASERGARQRGAFEVSQPVWVIFLVLNVALTFAARELVREVLERRWRAGIGLKRDPDRRRRRARPPRRRQDPRAPRARLSDRRLRRRPAAGDHLGYRGLPLLGTLDEAADIVRRESGRSPLRRAAARSSTCRCSS